ncbi:MAG TPA: thioredoxin family protein [Caldisericia bacterium]|nr:thioredoxin family protein [Caldisericia bacterium]
MSKKRIDLSVIGPILFLLVIVAGISIAINVLSKSGAVVNKSAQKTETKVKQEPVEEPSWKWDVEKLGKIRVLDIGRDDCVSCAQMNEIMLEMKKEFRDSVSFEIVDLAEFPQLESQYNISAVPTILVMDGLGRELYRKEGVWYKTEIREFFAKLGLEP